MDSKELCRELKVDAAKLAALVKAGAPREKVRGKWVYDLAAVREWLRNEARKQRATELTAGQASSGTPSPAAPKTEIIARTVPECLRVMAELGYPKSDRVFRTWMAEPKFPGTPGTRGKQDGEFPVYAILQWAGEISSEMGDTAASGTPISKGPKEEIWATRAERERLELEAYKRNLIQRNVTEATQLRIFGIVAAAFEALPDELTAALPEKLKARARADAEARLRKTLEVIADTIFEDGEEGD